MPSGVAWPTVSHTIRRCAPCSTAFVNSFVSTSGRERVVSSVTYATGRLYLRPRSIASADSFIIRARSQSSAYWRIGELPTPWCRVVIRPWLLRPPFLGSGWISDFSGVVRVISTKSATEEPRRPGVVGLYLRIAMFLVLVLLPGQETGPPKMSMRWPSARLTMARLVSLRLPEPVAGATRLARAVERVDRR